MATMARSCPPRFNPNSEIKMAGMRQAVGAETVWKNRRPTRRGLVRLPLREAHNLNGQLNGRGWGSQFSKPFKPDRLMPTGRFNFGVRVYITKSSAYVIMAIPNPGGIGLAIGCIAGLSSVALAKVDWQPA